jgi:biopolymer transport protein ExbB/TolQ
VFKDFTFFEILQSGGVAVYVLALFSIISLGVIFERLWAFYKFRKSSRAAFSVIKAGGAGNKDNDKGVIEAPDSPLTSVLKAGLLRRELGTGEALKAMDLSFRGEVASLRSLLGALATIGATAPFVGLFGTVIGIIRAFSDLALDDVGNPLAVVDGIAEALVATASGLFVAIPAVIAYNYFLRRSKRLSLELEEMASEFALSVVSLPKKEGE